MENGDSLIRQEKRLFLLDHMIMYMISVRGYVESVKMENGDSLIKQEG